MQAGGWEIRALRGWMKGVGRVCGFRSVWNGTDTRESDSLTGC